MPRAAFLGLLFVVLGLTAAGTAAPDAPAPEFEPGQFITVGNPITSNVVEQIIGTIESAKTRKGIKKVVLDFNPNGQRAATEKIGPCLDLAKYLRRLRGDGKVVTIAYVQAETARNTVLPVLACDRRVMGPGGRLGAVNADARSTPDPQDLAIYESYSPPAQAALVRKMLDARIAVLKGQKNDAVYYVDSTREQEALGERITISDRKPVVPAGALGFYDADEALRFGLCEAKVAGRQQLELDYGLPPGSHKEDVLAGRQRSPWRVVINGEITPKLKASVIRRLNRATNRGGNLIILQLECGAGDPKVAAELASHIRSLHGPDDAPVMTVAFIPHAANDNATFLALACHEIVMAKGARLGDFSSQLNPPVERRGPPPPKPDMTEVQTTLEGFAKAGGYSPVLIRGLLDEKLEIVSAHRVKGAVQERRFMTPEDLTELDLQGNPVWQREDTVKHSGKLLVITGETAPALGLARNVVSSPDDWNQVCEIYGIDAGEVHEARADWLDDVAEFFANPFVSGFLVLVGISCLILELKMPGASVPGIVAAICFVLFFWSQSQMNGQFTLLAVLLFLLGIVLLGMEIFVVPGFGVVGISGIVLILFSLALATVQHMPETSQQWSQLGGSMMVYSLSFVGALIVAFTAARFLPYIPVANRLVLQPPDEEADRDPMRSAQAAEQLALLGAIGTSATMLRPAGLAQFGDKFIDVVTDGGFIPAAARVQVIEIEGNRVVVKEV